MGATPIIGRCVTLAGTKGAPNHEMIRIAGTVFGCFIFTLIGLAEEPLCHPHPQGYLARRVAKPPVIDGQLNDEAWWRKPWTRDFADIQGHTQPKPRYRTWAMMVWDDQNLYIGAWLEEPDVWATITQHDAVIFHDNDFEVFVDPDGDNYNYFEIEVNALNAEWDLFLPRPYKDKGKADNSWEIPGLRSAVFVDGTLNDPRDVDRGWSVEMAIPWNAFRGHQRPGAGDRWRINFSRVEWRFAVRDGNYEKIKGLREDNWVWSPQYVINMHRPERWGYVEFTGPSETVTDTFREDPNWLIRDFLHSTYYRQKEFLKTHGRYTDSAAEIGVPGQISIELTANGFRAFQGSLSIDQDAHFHQK